MTSIDLDVVQALSDDLVSRIEGSGRELKGKVRPVFSLEELDTTVRQIGFPSVILSYSGMRGARGKESIFFDVVLLAQSISSSKVNGHRALPKATELLQKIRNSIAACKSPTGFAWTLVVEHPDFSSDDAVVYRQQWEAVYHIPH